MAVLTHAYKMDQQQLKKILVDSGYVDLKDWLSAESESNKRRIDPVDFLINQGSLNKDVYGQAMAEFFGVPYADLNSNMPSKEQIKELPEDVAVGMRLVLFKKTPKELILATDQPKNEKLLSYIKEKSVKIKIKLAYSLTEDIDSALLAYRQALATRFSKIIKEKHRIAPEIVDEIFFDAITYRASDIHFEPALEEVIVRFRIDGVLEEAGKLPREFYEGIVNRIKVKSRLRTDEHFSAQDGSLSYVKDNVGADMRVSIVPILEGEKIVIRLLSHYVRGLGLSDLGLSEKDQKLIEESANKPFGMILVVGPTGSGKTTTLYAVLKKLNTRDVNITTIEDPVEYKVVGVNQIQVNTQTNLTFAKGLRSVVRQDPDIIMVGEIRDNETAEISINAALTGHLLLSTFHANDASTGIPRLLDMGAEPFLLASTLEMIIAQRLARRICEKCRVSYVVKKNELIKKYPILSNYFKQNNITLYYGKGCGACHNSGYNGRVALFEIIKSSPRLQELILTSPSASQIWKLARQEGALSMFDDGVAKSLSGLITIDEVMRVVAPPAV